MRRIFSISALMAGLLACGTLISAAEFPAPLKISKDGTFKISEANFALQIYDASWGPSSNGQFVDRKFSLDRGIMNFSATLKNKSLSGSLTEKITALGNDEFEFDASASFSEGVTINGLFGTLRIPSEESFITVDDKKISLPAEFKDIGIMKKTKASKVIVPLDGGITLVATGDLNLTVQDNRKFGNQDFSLRFSFSQDSGAISSSNLKIKFKVECIKSEMVDISASANRGFADQEPGDGKGGWTDQGPDKDLHAMKPGIIQAEALKFKVIDPSKNKGNSIMALAGARRSNFPQSITLKLPASVQGGAINLLHASGWSLKKGELLGNMIVKYADGSSQTIPVRDNIDAANWWSPISCPNAYIAWTVETAEIVGGLYASSFAMEKKNPVEIVFQCGDHEAVWMIAALSLTDASIKFPAAVERDFFVIADAKWLPVNFRRDTVKGSALDFSWTNDAPAGKYGFIKSSPSGTLTFEKAPEKRVRLFGPNLCFTASYLDKETVDKLAATFVKCGYNTVRIHHHDTELTDPKASDTLTLNMEKLDKLDYLVSVMKKNGIYITTDMYTNRVFKPGDNIPECTFFGERQMKMLAPVSKAALDNWKEFARRWMTHKNPYTGMTWAEDPTVVAINLVNEETLSNNWSRTPESVALYKAKFEEWKKANKISDGSADNGSRIFKEFLAKTQEDCLNEQIRFIKEDLKMKTMVTSLNYVSTVPLTLLRDRFDIVDNHSYFDHPSFLEQKWQAPYRYQQGSAIGRMAHVPRTMMGTRIFGKPFMVTEFNYCNPNVFRAEGGPLIGAYAALQDWDGLYRFAWSHSDKGIYKVTATVGFDAVNDPMAQLSDRISIAMFMRGDVKAASKKYAYSVSPAIFRGEDPLEFPLNFQTLGLVAQIGSVPEKPGFKVPAGVTVIKPADSSDYAKAGDPAISEAWKSAVDFKKAESSTSELSLDSTKYSFTVDTARSESVTLKEGSLKAGALEVRDADSFQTVSAISLDGKALEESSSILLIHLTNISNTKMHFGNDKKTVLKAWGSLPLLVYRGTSKAVLKSSAPFKVTALSADGDALGEVKGTFSDSEFSFKLDPGTFPGGVMAYHLTR